MYNHFWRSRLNNFRIVYFSGTGCTALAANCLERTLRELGCEVGLERITAGSSANNSANHSAGNSDEGSSVDALILLFPIYACTAPGPVMEWLRDLGAAEGMPAAVISVSGGGEISPNTAGRVSVIKALERKGYDVFFEDTIVMPSNIAITTPEPLAVLLLQVLPEKVRTIADGLLAGGRKRKRPLVIDRFLAWAGKAERGAAKKWGRSIKVSDDCDGCRLCAEQCPTGNIAMADLRPGFSDKCCMCLGCFYACPRGALKPKTAKSIILKEFSLKALEEKALVFERADTAQIPAGLIWLGVKKYLK